MKGFTVLFFKKSQESCFSGTSGNSGGNGGGEGEANYISRGSSRGKTAGDLGERVPRVPRGIPITFSTFLRNSKMQVFLLRLQRLQHQTSPILLTENFDKY